MDDFRESLDEFRSRMQDHGKRKAQASVPFWVVPRRESIKRGDMVKAEPAPGFIQTRFLESRLGTSRLPLPRISRPALREPGAGNATAFCAF